MAARPPTRRRFLAALGSAAVGGLAGCSGPMTEPGTDRTTDWPMAHGTAGGRSYYEDAAVPRSEPQRRLDQPVGSPAGRPTVAGGRVFIPAIDALHAFDLKGGTARWTFRTGGNFWPTPPAIDDDLAFVGMQDEPVLLALDTADGTPRWDTPLEGAATVPPVLYPGDHRVFIGTDSGTVYCMARDTGEVRWRASTGDSNPAAICYRPPLLFVGTADGTVAGLAASDGGSAWSQSLDGGIRAMAVEDGDQLFVSTAPGTLARLSGGGDLGETVWAREDGPVAHGSLVLTEDRLIVTDGSGVYSFGRDRGRPHWHLEGDYRVPPAGAGDTVLVGTDDRVEAYRLDGGLGLGDIRINANRWRTRVDGDVVGGLAVAGGTVVGLAQRASATTAFVLEPT